MQKDSLIWLELIYETVQEFKAAEPNALFCYLSGGIPESEKALLPKYEPLIKKAVKKNKEFQDADAREFLSGLDLSYLLGLE